MIETPLNSVLCAYATYISVSPTISCTRSLIPRFIETSGEINEFVKMHVINLAERGLRQVGKRLYGAKIVVMGLAYKKNINDPRESPAIKIIEELANLGADVRVYDPFVPSLVTKAGEFASVGSVEEALFGAECAVFLVDHDVFWGISVETVKGFDGLAGGRGREELVYGQRGDCVSWDRERACLIGPFRALLANPLNIHPAGQFAPDRRNLQVLLKMNFVD